MFCFSYQRPSLPPLHWINMQPRLTVQVWALYFEQKLPSIPANKRTSAVLTLLTGSLMAVCFSGINPFLAFTNRHSTFQVFWRQESAFIFTFFVVAGTESKWEAACEVIRLKGLMRLAAFTKASFWKAFVSNSWQFNTKSRAPLFHYIALEVRCELSAGSNHSN